MSITIYNFFFCRVPIDFKNALSEHLRIFIVYRMYKIYKNQKNFSRLLNVSAFWGEKDKKHSPLKRAMNLLLFDIHKPRRLSTLSLQKFNFFLLSACCSIHSFSVKSDIFGDFHFCLLANLFDSRVPVFVDNKWHRHRNRLSLTLSRFFCQLPDRWLLFMIWGNQKGICGYEFFIWMLKITFEWWRISL